MSQCRAPGRPQVLQAWESAFNKHLPTHTHTNTTHPASVQAPAQGDGPCPWGGDGRRAHLPTLSCWGEAAPGERKVTWEGDSPAQCPGRRSRHRRRWCQDRTRRPVCCQEPGESPLWGGHAGLGGCWSREPTWGPGTPTQRALGTSRWGAAGRRGHPHACFSM